MSNKESRVGKKYRIKARALDKARDRIINAYISDSQRISAGVDTSLEFLMALTKAMGYKVETSKSDEYFYIR